MKALHYQHQPIILNTVTSTNYINEIIRLAYISLIQFTTENALTNPILYFLLSNFTHSEKLNLFSFINSISSPPFLII